MGWLQHQRWVSLASAQQEQILGKQKKYAKMMYFGQMFPIATRGLFIASSSQMIRRDSVNSSQLGAAQRMGMLCARTQNCKLPRQRPSHSFSCGVTAARNTHTRIL